MYLCHVCDMKMFEIFIVDVMLETMKLSSHLSDFMCMCTTFCHFKIMLSNNFCSFSSYVGLVVVVVVSNHFITQPLTNTWCFNCFFFIIQIVITMTFCACLDRKLHLFYLSCVFSSNFYFIKC